MTGFEDRVRSGLEVAAGEYEPSPRLRREVDRRVKRHRRGRIATGVVGTVGALLFVAGLGVLLATDDEGNQNESTAATTVPGGWSEVEVLGLTMEVPASWWQQSFDPSCDGQLVFLFGSAESVVRRQRVGPGLAESPSVTGSCEETWATRELPDTGVVVRLDPGAPASSSAGVVDSEFPIDPASLPPMSGDLAVMALVPIVVDGVEVARLSFWMGSAATDADLATAYRIIESIRPA